MSAAHDSPSCASLASPPAAVQTPRFYSDPHRPSAPRCCPRTAASTTSPGSTPPPASAYRTVKSQAEQIFSFFSIATRQQRLQASPLERPWALLRDTKTCCLCGKNILQKSRKNEKKRANVFRHVDTNETCTSASQGWDERMKGNSFYLSGVFVLTIWHLQHSVYVYIVGVKGLLFHLREIGRGMMRGRGREWTTGAHSPSGAWALRFECTHADVSAHT